jgi:hypothetical protein
MFRYNSGNPLGVFANVWYPGWEGLVYAACNPSINLGRMKRLRLAQRVDLQVRAKFLNVFNRHYFADLKTNMGDITTFGYVTFTMGNPRIIQFGLRLDW